MAESGVMRAHMPALNSAGVVQDFNPYIEAYRRSERSPNAGSGQIFGGAERELIVWQTRPVGPSDYELSLASTLEQIFAQRIYELPDIVAALNREGSCTPTGAAWTEQNFQATLHELGKLAFG